MTQLMTPDDPTDELLIAIAFGSQPFSAPLCGSVLSVVLGGALAAVPTTALTGASSTGASTESERFARDGAFAALESGCLGGAAGWASLSAC